MNRLTALNGRDPLLSPVIKAVYSTNVSIPMVMCDPWPTGTA